MTENNKAITLTENVNICENPICICKRRSETVMDAEEVTLQTDERQVYLRVQNHVAAEVQNN